MFKIVNSETDVSGTSNYAGQLRLIGQDLSRRSVLRFVIERDDTMFLVRVLDKKNTRPRKSILRGRVGKTLAVPSKNEVVSDAAVICYTRHDFERLERKWWAAKTTGTNRLPDIKSLAESLRTLGKFLDMEQATLLSIRKEPGEIVLHFCDRSGTKRVEEFSDISLCKLQLTLSSGRQKAGEDPWKNAKY